MDVITMHMEKYMTYTEHHIHSHNAGNTEDKQIKGT